MLLFFKEIVSIRYALLSSLKNNSEGGGIAKGRTEEISPLECLND